MDKKPHKSTKRIGTAMDYDLISEEEYENLPDEDDKKFLRLEMILRRNMNRLLDDGQNSQSFYDSVRLQYMYQVASAASELGVGQLFYPSSQGNTDNDLQEFLLEATKITTRLRIRSSVVKNNSVKLGEKTRGAIEREIQNLRVMISQAEGLAEERRAALLKKLAELSMELSQSRVSFAKVMSVIAYVSVEALTGVAASTTFFAEAPRALTTISMLLGRDKIAEDAEVKRLGAPPKRIAIASHSPAVKKLGEPSHGVGRMNDVIDDDIPF